MTKKLVLTEEETLERRRAQGRLRSQRYRDTKTSQERLALAVDAVTRRPARVSGSSKQALLGASLARHAVTVDKLVAAKAEALGAVKLRAVGNEIREQPDYACRLRANELLTTDLQLAGELPSARAPITVPLHVRVTVFNDAGGQSAKVIDLEAVPEAEAGENA